ncbi:hypothetical protein AT267_10740 [Bacillus cereus]|uniref:Uncharacterized protein n=2 Tax=Bacillus cereus group TaxID=86661 RepID=W8YM18_BACTU|nr:hypothetical protein AT267_10740 [Bacillus cereus]MBG9537020.1 hypothetical protein [Bacillus thuringiensis]CDN39772.1 unnamed protein product [Bacillus thuringiensis DB27]MBG9628531.1 hypothetical protein [Bacillus thuringiensis]MBG9664325.1 hypothetical protein [Bacillus thuringiensis]
MKKRNEILFMLSILIVIILMGFDIKNPIDQKNILIFIIYTIPIMLLLSYIKKIKYDKPNLFLMLIFLILTLWSILTFYLLSNLAIFISMTLGSSITLFIIFCYKLIKKKSAN